MRSRHCGEAISMVARRSCLVPLGVAMERTQCKQQGGDRWAWEEGARCLVAGRRPRASCPPRQSRAGSPSWQTWSVAGPGADADGAGRVRTGWWLELARGGRGSRALSAGGTTKGVTRMGCSLETNGAAGRGAGVVKDEAPNVVVWRGLWFVVCGLPFVGCRPGQHEECS